MRYKFLATALTMELGSEGDVLGRTGSALRSREDDGELWRGVFSIRRSSCKGRDFLDERFLNLKCFVTSCIVSHCDLQ